MTSRTLNYKHLHYFYVVAQEGSIAKASKRLHLTPQTISGQLSVLEESLNVRLFQKQGRGLQVTEQGQLVLRYAKDIFRLGEQLEETLINGLQETQNNIVIGILDSIPKIICYQIIKPILELESMIVTCIEGDFDSLMADLAIHRIDMVLADVPMSANHSVKAYHHLLGESPVSCFAANGLAARYRRRFPESLQGAPMLLPTDRGFLGRSIKNWLKDMDLSPRIRGYFDDSALLKAFGEAGEGVFFLPSAIETEICTQLDVKVIGRIAEIKERYFAITVNRVIRHPALLMICDEARENIFN